MKYLFKSRKRLGDALLCMPGALHLTRQGHEVWIECPEIWHPIFERVSYVRPWTPECGTPDRVFDTNLLNMRRCPGVIINYINEAYPELADVPKGEKVLFDRLPSGRPDGLPDRYTLVSPFGYSQRSTPPVEWFVDRVQRLFGSLDGIYWLTDGERSNCPKPSLTAKTVADLPAIIRDADEVLTVNSSPNIIASTVRSSHFVVWDHDVIHGRTNYVVPHQITLYKKRSEASNGNPIFASWYKSGGQGSGPGSSESYTEGWRGFIEEFLREKKIRTIVDFGCGDWQFSRLIDWGDRIYFGIDIVGGLIARLRREWGRQNRIFYAVDPLDPELPNEVDLVISKDVLQHLSNADIARVLEQFKRAKYWLLINDRITGKNNEDIATGGYRCLDLRKPPFNLDAKDVYTFPPQPHTPEIPKIAVLVENVT